MDVPSSPRAASSNAPSPTPQAPGAAACPAAGGRPPPAPRAFAKLLSASLRKTALGHGAAPLASPAAPLPARPAAAPALAVEPKETALGEKVAPQDGRERGGEGEGDGHGGGRDDARELDLLDPGLRHAASLGPPVLPLATASASATAAEAPLRARSLEELLPALVRRIAWAGDRHSGSVRLELGAGAYAGTTVVVHAEGGRVRVEISGHEGPDLDRLRSRLHSRLRGHGLDVESVV